MKYNFTDIIERNGKDALAVDGLGKYRGMSPDEPKEGFEFIPMWVADMNFATCPAITAAMENRLKHPLFGYFEPRQEYYDRIIAWQQEQNLVKELEAKHIGYENGVHGCITSAIQVFTQPGDKVLLHSPAYMGFMEDLKDTGRTAVFSPLVKDELGIWRMDYEDMDRCLKKYHIHLAIFCSPHNPSGRVWERWEIEKALAVYEANDCYVISDEIWSDITYRGVQHIPTQQVNDWAREHTIAVYAPSKTFNLAGLIGSYHIVYSDYLRDRLTRYGKATHYNEMNVLSMHALIGAYSANGEEWLEELRQVLSDNINYACDYIEKHFKGVKLSKPEGTYMLFIDCTDYCREHNKKIDEIIKAGWDVGVAWQDGRMFHGPCAIRINLALPFERVKEAFERMNKYVFCSL